MTEATEASDGEAPALVSVDAATGDVDVLAGNASGTVVRGAAVRGITYGATTGLIAIAFAFVFRALTPEQFAGFAIAIAVAAIAQSLGDVAVNTVGQRLLLEADSADRPALVAELVGVRWVVMPVMTVVGILYSLVAGYSSEIVWTVAIVCVGTTFYVSAAAWTAPLMIELRAGRASIVEAIRQAVIAVGLLIVVAFSGSLVDYGLVYLVAGVISVGVVLVLLEPKWRGIRLPRGETLRVVARQASWLAIAITVNSLFLKVLTLVASLEVSKFETGLFATAARVVEVLAALPLLMAAVAFPLLSRAATDDDHERLSNALSLVIRGVLLLLGGAVVVVVVGAVPLIHLFASDEYRGAGPVLQLQAFALLASSVTQALVWALIALRGERLLVFTNLIGLAVLLVLGAVLVNAYGAQGAAVAAIVAEVVLVGLTLLALRHLRADAVPNLVPLLATVGATLAAAAVGLVLPIPAVAAAVVAGLLYAAIVLALRLLPAEVLAALPLRRG
jgi:O-antigen/teichoic acid export membrane protein